MHELCMKIYYTQYTEPCTSMHAFVLQVFVIFGQNQKRGKDVGYHLSKTSLKSTMEYSILVANAKNDCFWVWSTGEKKP